MSGGAAEIGGAPMAPVSTPRTTDTVTAGGQLPAVAAMQLLAEGHQALGDTTPAVLATTSAAVATTDNDQLQCNGVRFLLDSAEFEWTPRCDRIPEQTWLKVKVKERGDRETDGDEYVGLQSVKQWNSAKFVELRTVAGVGKMCAKDGKIRLRYWDKAITPMFKGLNEYVKRFDVQLRLEVKGAIGEDTLAHSRWISASQLVAAAARNQPPVTEEMLAAQRQQRIEKDRKKQELLVRKQQEAKDKADKKKRDNERRVARELEKTKRDEEDAQAEVAWLAEGWRQFTPSNESLACLQALQTDFEGWYVRSARRTDEAGGKRIIYRTHREDSAQELWFDSEAELNSALLQLCRSHPIHCQVRVSPTLRPDFEGGLCTVNSREDTAGYVRVKSAVGSSAKIPRRDIEDWNASDHIYGVKSLKMYWKKLVSKPFPAWYQTLASARATRSVSAAWDATPIAAAGACGGEDQTPTPAVGSREREAQVVTESNGEVAEQERRESYPVEDPSEPVLNVKPERTQHVLLAGQPLKEAEANMGTLKNKKVFIGESNIVGADKGLFVSQACIPGEVITRFDGTPGMVSEFARKSHVITLEGGTAGRHLDCYGICSQFTAASKLHTPVGIYEAGRNCYYPVTDRYDNKSLYDVGLAAFANSSMSTDFVANARVEKTKYTPKGREGEATGYLPFAFLIATKRLQPGEEVLFEYEIVVDELDTNATTVAGVPTAIGGGGGVSVGGDGATCMDEEEQRQVNPSVDVGAAKRQRDSDSVDVNSCAKRRMPPPQHVRAAAYLNNNNARSIAGRASSDELLELLERLGLAHLALLLASEEIDLEALRLMKVADYSALGIKMGHRLKLMNALGM